MSDKNNEKMKEDYEVGYGKPPKSGQIQPGEVRNARGRPKGSKNKPKPISENRLANIVLEEAFRDVPVLERGVEVTIPMAAVVMRSVSTKAGNGDSRSQKTFLDAVKFAETARIQRHLQYLKTISDYKANWEQEKKYRNQKGLEIPEIIPHPDDFFIDSRTEEVRFRGPETEDEKEQCDWFYKVLDYHNINHKELKNDWSLNYDEKILREIEVKIECTQKKIENHKKNFGIFRSSGRNPTLGALV